MSRENQQDHANQQNSCPSWAHEQIEYLKQVEIHLGNIPKTSNWESQHISDVSKKLFEQECSTITEETSEFLFAKIVKGLFAEKYVPSDIADMINDRIRYKGGPPYCDEDLVRAEL